MPHSEKHNAKGQQLREARGEARRLLPLLGKNDTPETVRELIRVSLQEQAALRDFLMPGQLEKILAYRIRVEQEFERLAKKHVLEQPAVIGIDGTQTSSDTLSASWFPLTQSEAQNAAR